MHNRRKKSLIEKRSSSQQAESLNKALENEARGKRGNVPGLKHGKKHLVGYIPRLYNRNSQIK